MHTTLFLLLKIFFLILVSGGTFSYFLWRDSLSPVQSSHDLTSALQEVRFYGIGDKSSVIRRIGQEPRWLHSSLMVLYKGLETGLDPSGYPLTESQYKEIVSTIGVIGGYAQGGTSLLLKLFRETSSKDIRKEVLHALVRVKSSYESVEETLLPFCVSNTAKDTELADYSCAVLDNLGEGADEAVGERVKLFREEELSRFNELVSSPEKSRIDISQFRKTLYSLSLLGRKVPDAARQLQGNIELFEGDEIKVLIVSTLGDIAPTDDAEAIGLLSGVMQYGGSKLLRKQALLSLIGMGSEMSLHNARSYGHKYIHGDLRPEPVKEHPFRKWVLSRES